jgi:hypothetical protein
LAFLEGTLLEANMKTIKVLFAALLLIMAVIGIAVTGWGTYLSLSRQHLQLIAVKGFLLMSLPFAFVFVVSRVSSNWKRRA